MNRRSQVHEITLPVHEEPVGAAAIFDRQGRVARIAPANEFRPTRVGRPRRLQVAIKTVPQRSVKRDRVISLRDKIGADMRPRLAPAVLAGTLLALAGSGAWAGPPSDQLRARIDSVIKVLEDPEFKKDSKTAARRATIRAIAGEIFDFREISQRSLGRHWQTRTPAEREEFVALFGDLLERTYISKIEGYSGERIVYAGEKVDGDQVTVRTRIVTKQGTEIPVDYRMFERDGRWLVFDVNIEGVSLVGNYRSQFNAIIVRSSYQELVTKLKAKQDEGAEPTETGSHRRQAP